MHVEHKDLGEFVFCWCFWYASQAENAIVFHDISCHLGQLKLNDFTFKSNIRLCFFRCLYSNFVYFIFCSTSLVAALILRFWTSLLTKPFRQIPSKNTQIMFNYRKHDKNGEFHLPNSFTNQSNQSQKESSAISKIFTVLKVFSLSLISLLQNRIVCMCVCEILILKWKINSVKFSNSDHCKSYDYTLMKFFHVTFFSIFLFHLLRLYFTRFSRINGLY